MTELEFNQLNIIEHYGLDHQLNKLVGECGELIAAIAKYREGRALDSVYIDEIADVENLIKQIKLYDADIAKRVDMTIKFKIKRQLERIGKKIEYKY